jgi:phage regulator Rha-like protein
MSQLVNLENTRTMLSTEIAELTAKKHLHVMRDIRAIVKELENDNPSLDTGFKSTTYLAGNGKNEKCYELNYDATMVLLTGYSISLRAKVIARWRELEEQQKPQLPTNYIEALQALIESEKAKQLALENQAKAEAEVVKLNMVIDNEFGYSSILRAAKFLGIKETEFNWRTLKVVTLGLGLEVKRVPSPRYPYQNVYPIKAFQVAYPDYDFDDLKPESHDDKFELAYL